MAQPDRQEMADLLREARRALDEERWRDLLSLVRQLQTHDPDAARPFVEALWQHIQEEARHRQSRTEQALSLRRSAQEGHWQAVWDQVQALAREDRAGARHVARLLFVDPAYFTQEKPVEKVARPGLLSTLLSPLKVRLYLYGYGAGTLDGLWAAQVAVAASLVLLLAGLPTLASGAWWPLPAMAAVWGVGAWLVWRVRDRMACFGAPFRRWVLLLLSAVWVAAWVPWERVPIGLLALAVALLGLLAGWTRVWLHPAPAWWVGGATLGLVVRSTLPVFTPWMAGLGNLMVFLFAVVLAQAAAEAAQRGPWAMDRPSRWYLALLLAGYAVLAGLALYALARAL